MIKAFFVELKAHIQNEFMILFCTDEYICTQITCHFGRWYTSKGTYAGGTYRQAQQKDFLEKLEAIA